MLSNITILPDESLNGIEREYREVNRKAAEGGRIKIVKLEGSFGDYELGDVMSVHARDTGGVRTVETAGGWGGDGHIYVFDEEYVTLEPTDIVHLPIKGRISGTERFRMVDRKATIGDRVIVVSEGRESCGGAYYRKGNVGYFFDYGQLYGNIRVSFDGTSRKCYVSPGDYRVLEPVATASLLSEQSAQDQAAATIGALALRLETLEETVRSLSLDIRVAQEDINIMDESIAYDVRKLEAEVAALKKREGVRWEHLTDSITYATASTAKTFVESAQTRRDEIVERAKADVKRLTQIGGSVSERLPKSSPLHNDFFRVEFVVNRDRRTVVALLRPVYGSHFDIVTGSFSVIKGIAKAAPGDVFNAHIGKVIALHRALGLEVPEEYLNVPKPTEVRVGDVVEGTSHSGATGPVLETGHDGEENFVIYRNDTNRRYFNRCWSGVTRVTILDDTREEVAA